MGLADWLNKAYKNTVNAVKGGITNLKAGFDWARTQAAKVYGDVKGGVTGVYEDVKKSVQTVYSDTRKTVDSITTTIFNPFLWAIVGIGAIIVVPRVIDRIR